MDLCFWAGPSRSGVLHSSCAPVVGCVVGPSEVGWPTSFLPFTYPSTDHPSSYLSTLPLSSRRLLSSPRSDSWASGADRPTLVARSSPATSIHPVRPAPHFPSPPLPSISDPLQPPPLINKHVQPSIDDNLIRHNLGGAEFRIFSKQGKSMVGGF